MRILRDVQRFETAKSELYNVQRTLHNNRVHSPPRPKNEEEDEETTNDDVANKSISSIALSNNKRDSSPFSRFTMPRHQEEKKTEDSPPYDAVTGLLSSAHKEDLRTFHALVEQQPHVVRKLLQPTRPRVVVVQAEVSRPSPKPPRRWVLRSLFLDLPLALLFASFLLVHVIQILHTDYYRPLFERSRRTDDDLLDEFTYYERQCNEYDVTTHTLQDFLVNSSSSTDAVDMIMTHGAVVIPRVLDAATVDALRQHVARRNAATSEQEKFPVSDGMEGLRISYGIDATEDPAVSHALSQIAKHALLRQLLIDLTGDVDPASAEITAITVYAGADHQSWHADTKGDGNALKFARTYSHSYSLFVPLQDTTESMGATDICPGTQYCANDMTEVCENNKVGLHLVHPDRNIVEAGDALLINQHVWHRGSAHTDPSASERIVFIVSFLARPRSGDARQLSRGTYFHQKWNMWGHTWKDLLDPAATMTQPFSILRALGLWKPVHYNWGYDLVTAMFMRFCNEQLEEDELYGRLVTRLDELKFPIFLRGRVLMDASSQKESWQVFVQETIDKTFAFVQTVNCGVHGVYAAAVLLVTLVTRRASVSRSSLVRLVLTHGTLLLLTYNVLEGVRTSRWGTDVLSGRTLMRPFPPVQLAREDDMAPVGLSTLPSRIDVLVGTRYDASFLGSYDRWLDYHPGNVVLRRQVSERAGLYGTYRRMPTAVFTERLEQEVLKQIKDGRFLHQDYRTGDWRIMTEADALGVVREELMVSGNGVLAALRKSMDWMVADYRFGTFRSTTLARISQVSLKKLRESILPASRPVKALPLNSTAVSSRFRVPRRLVVMPKRLPTLSSSPSTLRPLPERFSLPLENKIDFEVGTLAWVGYASQEWYPGSITRVHGNVHQFDVAYDDGSVEVGVTRRRLRKFTAVVEGDRVEGCYQPELQECYSGTVGRVHPSGQVMITYDDGDVEWNVPPDRYFVPPYRYGWDY
jgi:ectoine hydroxylase-related dioxygenase (phytanoyl-CoA dioxygenase family)